jgi:hypothetical protein
MLTQHTNTIILQVSLCHASRALLQRQHPPGLSLCAGVLRIFNSAGNDARRNLPTASSGVPLITCTQLFMQQLIAADYNLEQLLHHVALLRQRAVGAQIRHVGEPHGLHASPQPGVMQRDYG